MNFNLKVGIGSFLCGMVLAVCAVDLDLNGSWAFRFEEGRALEDVAKADFEATGTMPVPTCFYMTPQCLCKRGTALYRRTFALDHPVENAWLIIDGMGMRGSFAVDGRSLGVYPYPYAQLELETGPLAAGEHEIFAALDNRFDWQTREMVRASLNHPCVIMYSIGNEIVDGYPEFGRTTEDFIADAKRLARFVREEDPTRPSTNANNNKDNYTNSFPRTLPLLGCNYYSWQYGAFRKKYPDVPFFASESQCMSVTRGEFRFPVRKRWPSAAENPGKFNSAYCWEAGGWSKLGAGWACPPDVQWYYMDQYPDCLGEFIWTGVDYLGGPYWVDSWKTPLHTCNVGFIDSAGFRKDSFYLYQSRWLPEKPMAHILPHWNWKGREGEVTPVYVFTSGDEGELFVNGVSQGRRRKEPGVWDRAYRLCWDDVRYAPGRVEVVVYRKGAVWARDVVETTGDATQLKIDVAHERPTLVSDGEDVAFVNVSLRDAAGRVVPVARDRVQFRIAGPGEILAVDNGDERDFDDIHAGSRRALAGWVQALVRGTEGRTGTIRVTATAEGRTSATADIALSK